MVSRVSRPRQKKPTADANGKLLAALLDPATEAKKFLTTQITDEWPRIAFWRDGFHVFGASNCYEPLAKAEARAMLIRFLNKAYAQLSTTITSNVLDQLKAIAMLPSNVEPRAWLDRGQHEWPASEIIVAKNGLVNIGLIGSGKKCLISATPRFFALNALDFSFDPEAPAPAEFLKFLDQLWPRDPASIETIQEWCGYCVAGGTQLQKMLALIGPKRSGKGTLARILRLLVGKANSCGPTLSGLATNFGLWPLVDKQLAVIADARMSPRLDQATVVERLLSITGEDALTVDRKNMAPITCILPTRIMLVSNELPRLGDASGAMSSRIVLLKLTESFYGREDTTLTQRLTEELPGILLWAIEGWQRLQQRGHFVQPESGLRMVADLEELGSPITAFVRERCLVQPGCQAAVADLFAEWQKWSEENGRRDAGTKQTFGRDLLAAFPGLETTQPRDESGARYRAYEGIGIKTNSSMGF